jgi:hypothetical protein
MAHRAALIRALGVAGRAMTIRLGKICNVLVCVLCSVQFAGAQCKKARNNDSPHGANEFILLKERTVRQIHGSVFFPKDNKAGRARAENIVVELYSYIGGENYNDVNQVLQERKRVVACVTSHDGRFSFVGLKQGRYLLRAGTLSQDQFNEVYIILRLDPHGVNKGVDIILPLGT